MIRARVTNRRGELRQRGSQYHHPMIVEASCEPFPTGPGYLPYTKATVRMEQDGSGSVTIARQGHPPVVIPWPNPWSNEEFGVPESKTRYRAEVDFIEV